MAGSCVGDKKKLHQKVTISRCCAFKIGTLPEGFKDIASELRGIAGIRV